MDKVTGFPIGKVTGSRSPKLPSYPAVGLRARTVPLLRAEEKPLPTLLSQIGSGTLYIHAPLQNPTWLILATLATYGESGPL